MIRYTFLLTSFRHNSVEEELRQRMITLISYYLKICGLVGKQVNDQVVISFHLYS